MFKRNSKGQFVKDDPFLIARNKSQKQKDAVRKALTGIKRSKKTIKKLRKVTLERYRNGEKFGFEKGNTLKGNTGKKASLKTIKKLRESHLGQNTGEQHHNWKGGVTPINEKIRKSSKYKVWRLDVYGRDNFTCQMPKCNKKGGDIEAHHIKRFADFPELRFDINNGITLCGKCHKLTLRKEEKFEKLFNEIIKIV